MKNIFFILISFSFSSLLAQKGKDGPGNIAGTSTVNIYTSLTTDATAGSSAVAVTSTVGFSAGDLIYIVQMQGATVNCFPEAVNPNNSMPMASNYGGIVSYNNAGHNEVQEIASVSGNNLNLNCALNNSYTVAGKVQVIRVPRYSTLTIASTGIITCPPWNGTTGGVIAIEVDGSTTINAGGKIDASSLGFRGGIVNGNTATAFGGGSWGHLNHAEGAMKGESIAGDTLNYTAFAGKFAKGAVANGGGGGTSNNAGGGGGANAGDTSLWTGKGNPDLSVASWATAWNLEAAGTSTMTSSGGGRGGYSYSNSTSSPTVTAPGSGSWNGDSRRVQGGLGGRPLNYNSGRVFLGGGGGAGDHNDNYGGAGGNGGGIVYILSYGDISGGGQILANGQAGYNTKTTGNPAINDCNGRDGAGGAGGGGAVIIHSTGALSSLTISATGGSGGNQQMKSGYLTGTPMAYGPGGGGGGGYIGTNATATISTNTAGGTNGIVQYLSGSNTCKIDDQFPPNGATKGGAGSVLNNLIPPSTITAVTAYTICSGQSLSLTATSTNTSATINWYDAITGNTIIASGTVYTTPTYTAAGTYTLYAGSCPGTYRQPITITVSNGLNLNVNSPTICTGETATLTVTGATTYTWLPGNQNTSSISVNPSSTTVYTVSGSSGSCSGSMTSTVTVLSQPTLNVSDQSICSGETITLSTTGATNYTWMPGAQNSSSISVTPSVTTSYTVTGANGTCTNSAIVSVSVTPTPTISVSSLTVCTGQTATLSASGAASYTWSPGNITGTTYTDNPSGNTTYTIVGATSSCTAQTTASVTVGSNISIIVNSPTICSGQSATLTASGATNYTWSPGGANTTSIVVSPTATAIYSINGTNGSCSGAGSSTVTVNANPTLTVTSTAICSGQTSTLTALGANTYTWSNSIYTSTQTVNPSSNTTYTVSGEANGCVSSATTEVVVTATPTVSVNSATICSGVTATLTASGATNYTWSTNQNTPSINPTPSVTTTYTVTGDNGGCSSTATATVIVDNTTLSSYSIAVSSCPSQTVELYGAGTNSATSTYTWSNGVNTYSQVVSPVVTTTYVVNATSASGCPAASGTVIVNVTSISASFSGLNNTTMTVGETLNLTNTSIGATSVSWNYCNGTSANNQISILLSDTGICCITLIAQSSNNCSDTTIQCVKVINEASIVVPNVFTPNGDGKNDVFKIISSGLKTLHVTIYDRWGLKMYEWDGVNGYWDGKSKSGALAPAGTYFYILSYTDVKDQSKNEKGFITLIGN